MFGLVLDNNLKKDTVILQCKLFWKLKAKVGSVNATFTGQRYIYKKNKKNLENLSSEAELKISQS